MVLQQEAKLPVWGWATPGEKIKVMLGAANVETIADPGGSWRVELPPLPSGAPPQTLVVAGMNTLRFDDVLVGDVWLASGQSNMEFGIDSDIRGVETVAKADEPQIRLFVVPKRSALEPQTEIGAPAEKASAIGAVLDDTLVGKWQICTPKTLACDDNFTRRGVRPGPGFSAVSYYFGREIHHSTGRPVGLIGCYVGGSSAQSWVSLSTLEKNPLLHHYAADCQNMKADLPRSIAAYPKLLADYETASARWELEIGGSFKDAIDAWKVASAKAKATGQPLPPQPKPSRPKPNPPIPSHGNGHHPTALFNGMLAPVIPYAIKGVIWYQGESNHGFGKEYAVLFPKLIEDWRTQWNQGDFPFLFVQLPGSSPTKKPVQTPAEGSWPWVRDAQLNALSLPATGMAVTIDIGDPDDVHPHDKYDVGLRLARVARSVVYEEKIVATGPLYKTMTVEGNRVRISFRDIGRGLAIGSPPWTSTGIVPPTPSKLTGFGIAGADRKWFWAQAKIEGDTVVVWSDEVASPVAVRYGWADNPSCDLYNKDGLPASPFRTDDWDDSSSGLIFPAAPAK